MSMPRRTAVLLALLAAAALTGGAASAAVRSQPASSERQRVENGPIAFARFDPALHDFSLWTARSDGSHQRRLTRTPSYFSDWRPDGSRLAFDYTDGSDEHIASIAPNGSRRVQLTSGHGIQEVPRYSPDGRHIAFDASAMSPDDPAFSTHISVMDADGSHIRQITRGGFDVEPAYSPDGRRLVFGRIVPAPDPGDRNQYEAIYVVRTDGTGLHRVVAPRAALEHPRWSPDGRSITFNIAPEATGAKDAGSILAVRPDGSGLHVLRAATADWGFTKAVWAPEGQALLVVCHSVSAETDYLCRLDPRTARFHVVVRTPGDQPVNFPSWGRDRD